MGDLTAVPVGDAGAARNRRSEEELAALFAKLLNEAPQGAKGANNASASTRAAASAQTATGQSGADPRQTFAAAFEALKAEGSSPSEQTKLKARNAAVGLMQSAIRENRPGYIADARSAMGADEFNRSLDSVGANSYYANTTERILTAAQAGDAKALGGVKNEVNEQLKAGDLRYWNLSKSATPLWYAADSAQRAIAGGKPFDPKAMGATVTERWANGASDPAQLSRPGNLEAGLVIPAGMASKVATGMATAAGDMQAVMSDGPVRTEDGHVYARDGLYGEEYLYHNKLTGEYFWNDPQNHRLAERGTVSTVASLPMTGGLGAAAPRGALAANGAKQGGKLVGAAEAAAEGAAAKRTPIVSAEGQAPQTTSTPERSPASSVGVVWQGKELNKDEIFSRLRGAAETVRSKVLNKPAGKANVAVAEVYIDNGPAFGIPATSRGKGLNKEIPTPKSKGGCSSLQSIPSQGA